MRMIMLICECRLWKEMVMVFDNKNVVFLVSSRKLLQRKKERINILCLNEKGFIVFMVFFLCTIQKREISLILARARPLAAKFCTKTL